MVNSASSGRSDRGAIIATRDQSRENEVNWNCDSYRMTAKPRLPVYHPVDKGSRLTTSLFSGRPGHFGSEPQAGDTGFTAVWRRRGPCAEQMIRYM